MIIGYARVSTTLQDTRLQLDALARAGAETVYQEKVSAVAAKRPELERLLASLQPGDIVKVYKTDRFARSMIHLLTILQRIETAGASFVSITEPFDTSSAAGIMMIQMLGAFAEFERSMIRERTIAGQIAAYKRGVKLGRRKHATSDETVAEMRILYAKGIFTYPDLGAFYGLHPSTVKRLITGKKSKPTMPVLSRFLAKSEATTERK